MEVEWIDIIGFICVEEGYILDMSEDCALMIDQCAFRVLNVQECNVAYIEIIEYKRPGNIGDAMIEMGKTYNTKVGECVVIQNTEYTGDYNMNETE